LGPKTSIKKEGSAKQTGTGEVNLTWKADIDKKRIGKKKIRTIVGTKDKENSQRKGRGKTFYANRKPSAGEGALFKKNFRKVIATGDTKVEARPGKTYAAEVQGES